MLLVMKMLNSAFLTMNEKFMGIDISKFYLNTLLPRFKYLKLKLSNIPQEVIKDYNLDQKATSDIHVYIEIQNDMYSLPQAELLTQ